WRQHKKHVFILSCAGKPIYTRYGDEDQQASLFGTLLTLSQFLQHTTNHHTEKDVLKCICAGQHRIMFMSQEFMVLVIVSQSLPGQHPEPSHSLMQQLSYIYYQVISILSYSRMKVVYEQRPNYDLRRLLSGAEKFIDSLLESMDRDPGYLLCSVKCLPLDVSERESIAQAISTNAKIKDLVFALLISGNQLIALIRLKQYLLHPIDLHVLFNLVTSSESFKHAESWTPICLPKFDPNGYLHCHISYLDDACKVCLLLLSVNKDSFYVLSECKNRIKEKLTKLNSLNCLSELLSKSSYYQVSHCGIPGLLHFIYKARTTGQFTEPEHSGPYLDQENRERLFSLFRYIYGLMHTPSRPLKIYYHVGSKENILAWVTNHFDMYAVFSPLATKNQAIQMVNKLLKWIKKEENRLFVLSSHII
ncbi:hypothetical protein HELRODRAFT_65589, partial [Helobdella robusta]|uniref:Vacuolar fusion protein MON1 homolog n=1 Tax=Helobdella robusta TaxID=6412 RepID=T1FYA3_HELRO